MNRWLWCALSVTWTLSACVSRGPRVDPALRERIQGRLVSLEIPQADDTQSACAQGWALACAFDSSEAEVSPTLSIIQGVTNDTSTQLGVLSKRGPGRQHFWLVTRAAGGRVTDIRPIRNIVEEMDPKQKWVVRQMRVDGLKVGGRYELWVLLELGGRYDILDLRRFGVPNTKTADSRLAVMSCLDDRLAQEADRAWSLVAQAKPDWVLMIGDNVYVDAGLPAAVHGSTPPRVLWERFIEARERIPFFRWKTLKPTLATWDDHDYGLNNGGADYPYRESSEQIFSIFFPRAPMSGWEAGPGLARRWRAFGADWVFLDGRSFRTPNGGQGVDASHLGQEQLTWLLKIAQESESRPLVLIKGDQFWGRHHQFESFETAHPKEFSNLMLALKRARRPLMFISGDRHLFELLKVPGEILGRSTFELTTSALHARVYPGALSKSRSPWMIEGKDGTLNFAVLVPRFQVGQSHLRVEGWYLDGQGPSFSRDLTLSRRSH